MEPTRAEPGPTIGVYVKTQSLDPEPEPQNLPFCAADGGGGSVRIGLGPLCVVQKKQREGVEKKMGQPFSRKSEACGPFSPGMCKIGRQNVLGLTARRGEVKFGTLICVLLPFPSLPPTVARIVTAEGSWTQGKVGVMENTWRCRMKRKVLLKEGAETKLEIPKGAQVKMGVTES